MATTSLAVKYRPSKFEDVSEQSLIVEILKNLSEAETLSNRNFLLIGPAGCGKAQPMDSLVLTPNGFLEMKYIEPGTEVITHRGLTASVLHVFPQGEREIFSILLEDGRFIKVSDNHLNCVVVHTTSGDVSVILTTQQIIQYMNKGMRLSIPFPEFEDSSLKSKPWYPEYRKYQIQSEAFNGGCEIRAVTSLGFQECQCIYIDDEDHTYVSDYYIPTHNTTLARIMANTLNENKGEPIEIDAASHSGVEGMREIIKQAQQYPIGTKYKTFIVDECFSGNTKVLTNEGFKAFKDLTHNELIAQYDEGTISFVKPTRWIKKEYDGDGYYFNPGCNAHEVLMTAHHVQPIVDVTDPENIKVREGYIEDLEFHEGDRVETVGVVDDGRSELTALDEVVMVSMMYASGLGKSIETIEDSIPCSIPAVHQILSNEHYLTLCSRLAQAGIKYADLGDIIQYDLPVRCSSVISSYFRLDQFNQFGAMDFLNKFAYWSVGCIVEDMYTPIRRANAEFLNHWDNPHSSLRYSGYNITNLQFVASMCLIAGAPVEVDEVKCMLKYSLEGLTTPSKRKTHIKDTVYCVEVPSHNIIVQASGFAFVTGNCHALSSAAWQSVLKTLEEGPAKSVFFFATTNPEKIPATIISRVQTFQLSKISLDGITKRLKAVCDAEIAEGRKLTYTDDALQFLAKLAGGGMRDALTNLDKALAFSSDINIENLSKSLNLPKYDDYFDLLNAYAKKDNAKIAKIINEVYNSGVNFVRWFEGFHSFVINVTKFIFLQDISVTMIPSQYLDKISKYTATHSVVCLKLANKLLSLISALKSTQYLQEVALTYLCSVPTGGK